MAVEETKIELELEADVYTLKRTNAGGVRLHLGDNAQPVPPKITGAKVKENCDLEILGRPLGKVDAAKCTMKIDGNETASTLEALRDIIGIWYPPGHVEHVHNSDDFKEYKDSDTILCAKFSAEWCFPCKMVAPAIEALSLKYTNVKFVHLDEAETKEVFRKEGIRAYPTFKFFKNGSQIGEVVQGADADKVEKSVRQLGGVAVETSPKPEGTIRFVCQRETLKLEKTESGITFTYNGKKEAKCPRVELNVAEKEVSFGKRGGKVWSEGGYDLAAMAKTLNEWFPTKVKHIHTPSEFTEIAASGITVAKFSADWCGPCKNIAGDYHEMSLKNQHVTFLHIDVDSPKLKKFCHQQGIEAMPTFHFFKDGERQESLMIQGAEIEKVKRHLAKLCKVKN